MSVGEGHARDMSGQFERKYKVRRAKLMGFKTCLIADEPIPKGAFLFFNHSEMIDIKKLEESGKIGRNGAGKIFLISLSDPDIKRSSGLTLQQAESDSKWDFRFMNPPPALSKYRRKPKKPNVELGARIYLAEGSVDSATPAKTARNLRPFYTTEDVQAGQELYFDYRYHKPKDLKCSCGLPADSCDIFGRRQRRKDDSLVDDCLVEAIVKDFYQRNSPNPENERRYFVKWEGYDIVNNSWCGESELFELDLFKEYEKVRKARAKRHLAKHPRITTIRAHSTDTAYVENADSSSGEEDDRLDLQQSTPLKVIHISKEVVDGKSDVFCYVKFSNQEILRIPRSRFFRQAPSLVFAYFESRLVFTGEGTGHQTENSWRTTPHRTRQIVEFEPCTNPTVVQSTGHFQIRRTTGLKMTTAKQEPPTLEPLEPTLEPPTKRLRLMDLSQYPDKKHRILKEKYQNI